MQFHLMYRDKRHKVWHLFGFNYERAQDCDLKAYRKRYPSYKFRLVFY